jgi:trimethylamine-N-oxide reductase (cytochrome c)
MKKIMLRTILSTFPKAMRAAALINEDFRNHLQTNNAIVQIRLKDNSVVHYYAFENGKILSRPILHEKPDVEIIFKSVRVALGFLKASPDQGDIVHFIKNYQVELLGDDLLSHWFATLVKKMTSGFLSKGVLMPDGAVRYTTNTNGGPLFVFVKNNKIIRTLPIDLMDDDPASWTIKAHGESFTPLRKSLVNVHALASKSLVYSDKRLLYPMKRIDFDSQGERNTKNRGISGYERISWEEALDIVVSEITRQKTVHGPGSITLFHPAHHTQGNLGYWLSALFRFGNIIGVTPMAFSPISWEGWYWGAQHHYGNSLRLGHAGSYGTVEDCLQEAELIVFWASDPESTSGLYAGFEGTQRRLWAKKLGIQFVHIDPHYNHTAQLLGGKWLPVRPTTDSALAHAIMYVWIVEDLYDKDYVAKRTTGFDEWKAYILGETDGTPKTPKWQEAETGISAKDVLSLARLWASKKTYLSAGGLGGGFGGACRASSGLQWARNMILLMAMQGWGKPGVNFGNLQCGAPLDMSIYFPGYAEGGISGDLERTASSINNYTRMPHVLTKNTVAQIMPREGLPEAVKQDNCVMFPWDGSSLEKQFDPVEYPKPGYSRVHMLYRYGASSFGTTMNSSRLVDMYRDESMEFVVNQSIWNEGEVQFADIILPACTSFERYDISEVCGCAGYIHHNQNQMNHRMVVMQHKCIEPLGESKSDYQIFLDILSRLGFGMMFSEGCDDLDWCKRIFESSDLKYYISWKDFLKKGYVVLPPEDEKTRDPVYMRWYAEGKKKDVPQPHHLPANYSKKFLEGLKTQSGKIEFLTNSLRRVAPDNKERPVLNRYMTSWEGRRSKTLFKKYPLQMVSAHPRYSFHTQADGKNSHINSIKDHRITVDGYAYWVIHMNNHDAKERNLRQNSLVAVSNDRGTVICAVDISPLVARGVVKTFESCAEFDFVETSDGRIIDRGGSVNLLTPSRSQAEGTSAIAPNSCLVEVTEWTGSWSEAANE